MMKWLTIGAVIFLTPLGMLLLWTSPANGQSTSNVSGVVRLPNASPAVGAWVRVQATSNVTYAAADGSFTLSGLTTGAIITVTAWYTDYRIAWATVAPPNNGLVFTLVSYDAPDNPGYAWFTSYPDANNALACGNCMSPIFPQWQNTAHAGSATNLRFLSIYNGTDLNNTRTVAPGFKLDAPGAAGICATCHAPGAAVNAPLTTDMNAITGVNRQGVFCDFCHKVGKVTLDPATNRPYTDQPGVMAMRFYRAWPNDVIWFGSLDDVTRRVTYLPLEKKSQFCAPCHQLTLLGTPIYTSYQEWQASVYPGLGVECQTCHMPPGTNSSFVAPGIPGAFQRDPQRLGSHLDLGLKDLAFMQNTIAMTLSVGLSSQATEARVSLQNVGAGHHMPTDSPLRNMILIVTATDAAGNALAQQSGTLVPTWGGNYAGAAGQGYAKILRDVATGESPVASYWKQTEIASDNRIPARATDTTVFTFALPPPDQSATIKATLIYRRAFQALELAKEWQSSDLILAQRTIKADVDTNGIYLPLIRRTP